MAVTFIHTADWQIGKPYYTITDDTKRALLQQERIEVIKRIGIVAQDTKAKFIVVAGDLFDSPSPTKSTVSTACIAIGALKIPVYVIPGNHDNGGVGSLWQQDFFLREQRQLAPNMIVLLEPKPMEIDDAILFPCPLLRRHESVDPTAWLRSFDFNQLTNTNKPRIIIAHGSVQNFGDFTDDESPDDVPNYIELEKLNHQDFDYIALGDWHGAKDVMGKAWYSGTPELDRFPKGADHDQGNVMVITVERNVYPNVKKVKASNVNWIELSQQLNGKSDLAILKQTITNSIHGDISKTLLQLYLDGRLGLEDHQELNEYIDSLQARFFRIKLFNHVDVEPTDEELNSLLNRTGDPLISGVAADLAEMINKEIEPQDARLALIELYMACNQH